MPLDRKKCADRPPAKTAPAATPEDKSDRAPILDDSPPTAAAPVTPKEWSAPIRESSRESSVPFPLKCMNRIAGLGPAHKGGVNCFAGLVQAGKDRAAIAAARHAAWHD